jgi:hypothetical protein
VQRLPKRKLHKALTIQLSVTDFFGKRKVICTQL